MTLTVVQLPNFMYHLSRLFLSFSSVYGTPLTPPIKPSCKQAAIIVVSILFLFMHA